MSVPTKEMAGELAGLAAELKARVQASRPEEWAPPSPREDSAQLVFGATATATDTTEPSPVPGSAEVLPFASSTAPVADPAAALAEEAARANECRRCPLGGHRLRAVFGVGSPTARVMFVGEGPGFEEDHRGEPFVGKAGQLLDRILAAIGLDRKTVYIANMVKCHPMIEPDPERRGNDRPPTPEEMAACRPFLERQIEIIRPKVVVTLGAVAARALLGTQSGITHLRGRWQTIPGPGGEPLKVLPTYHPAALLRNPNLKRDVWEDMKALRAFLGENR